MIPQIKKILYATDLSKNSSYAFLFATDMAKRHDARIVILHAIEPIPTYVEVYGAMTDEFEKKKHDEIIESIRVVFPAACGVKCLCERICPQKS